MCFQDLVEYVKRKRLLSFQDKKDERRRTSKSDKVVLKWEKKYKK